MKKLDVTINHDSTTNWQFLNLNYAENEPDLNEKIAEVFLKIQKDELETAADLYTHIIENFSQNECLVLAEMFFTEKYKSATNNFQKLRNIIESFNEFQGKRKNLNTSPD